MKNLETFHRYFHGDKDTHMVTHLTFTCSKSTIETLKKSLKYVESWQLSFSSVSIVDFEHVNVSCEYLSTHYKLQRHN